MTIASIFSEDKIDSIHYYADYISKEADQLKFNKGNMLSLRLMGAKRN